MFNAVFFLARGDMIFRIVPTRTLAFTWCSAMVTSTEASGGHAFEIACFLAQVPAALLDATHHGGAADNRGSDLRSQSAIAARYRAMVRALRNPQRDPLEWFGREKWAYCRQLVECRPQPKASSCGSMARRNLPVPVATASFDHTRRESGPAPGTSTYVLRLEYRDGALNGFAACQDGRKALEYGSRDGFPAGVRRIFEVDGQSSSSWPVRRLRWSVRPTLPNAMKRCSSISQHCSRGDRWRIYLR